MAHLTRRQLLGASTALLGAGEAMAAAPLRLQILVTKSSSLQNISVADLRQLFRGRLLSFAGQSAVPLNHPPRAADRIIFDRLVLGMNADEISRYWVDQKIRGGTTPPRIVDSVGLLLRTIARLPGAVGYVREGFTAPDVRAIAIDGKMPTDPGYPLTS